MSEELLKVENLRYEYWILVAVLILMASGLLMVASSSMVISERQFGHPFYYFFHQAVYLLLAIWLGSLMLFVPISRWYKWSGYLFVSGILLLIMVLIPGIGRHVNGSARWLPLGIISFQVSEWMKCAAIFFISRYSVKHQIDLHKNIIAFIKPLVLLSIIAFLLLREPDFGATTVLMGISLGILFLAGARLDQFIIILILLLLSFSLLVLFSPYRLARLTSFLNPWADQFKTGYQLTQSLIAFGRGGIFGVGLGNSVQKLFYLPEAHTDFLFAVLGEELGLVGQLAICTLFVILVGRIFILAKRAIDKRQLFSAYVAYGIGLWISLQALINIGVNLGILPTKGLTLPFMSYGGSSLLFNGMVIGILQRINHELFLGDNTSGDLSNRSFDGDN